MPEDFEDIRKELIFLLSKYLDMYIKFAEIYENNREEYESNLKVIINIMNRLQQLRCISAIKNVH